MPSEMGEIEEDRTLVYGTGDETISILLLKQEIGHGLIGMIQSKKFEENVALVVIHGSPEDEDFDIAYHGHSRDGKAERVGMDASLIEDLRRESDEAVTILFHELGHLTNRDIVAVGEDFELYNQSRKAIALNGNVLEIELKADDFAASYLGRQVVIKGLTALIERERRYYTPDLFEQQDIEIMTKEIQYRIKHQREALVG